MLNNILNLSISDFIKDRYDISLESFQKLLFQPRANSDLAFIRIFIFTFFFYKLLCRDFSHAGLAPDFMLQIYPSSTYSLKNAYTILGLPFLVDLFNFHWIHWFVKLPGVHTMALIQYISLLLCLRVVFFGRGYKNINAILCYCFLAYLFTYNTRAGEDEDAVFIPLTIVLIYCFTNFKECWILSRNRSAPLEFTPEGGWFYSMVILSFVGYYFASGINKIVDISILDWFRFDLVGVMQIDIEKKQLGYFINPPEFFYFLGNYPILNKIGVPIVYLSHLFIPIMFFKRGAIPKFWMFYWAFHALSTGVNIFFFGLVLVWFVHIPFHRFFQPVVAIWDSDCLFCKKSMLKIKRFDWFNKLTLIGSAEVENANPSFVSGWDREKGLEEMWVRGIDSPTEHYGFSGYRRICWVLPIFWVILPILYLPGVPFIGNKIYLFIARNRYRLGCKSNSCQINNQI